MDFTDLLIVRPRYSDGGLGSTTVYLARGVLTTDAGTSAYASVCASKESGPLRNDGPPEFMYLPSHSYDVRTVSL